MKLGPYELLGETTAGPRRRALIDEALACAHRAADQQVLAEVLDARLHALWDPGAAADRLSTAAEIEALARACGDDVRKRLRVENDDSAPL